MGCFCTLRPNSKSANILKAAFRSHRIENALQVFKSGSVFDALHWRVRYFQMSVYNLDESILCREG